VAPDGHAHHLPAAPGTHEEKKKKEDLMHLIRLKMH
jgi:hypothetical protein